MCLHLAKHSLVFCWHTCISSHDCICRVLFAYSFCATVAIGSFLLVVEVNHVFHPFPSPSRALCCLVNFAPLWPGCRYGRWTANLTRFPGGMGPVAAAVHGRGQRFGLYVNPGVAVAAVKTRSPIEGTNCTAADIAIQPYVHACFLVTAGGEGRGGTMKRSIVLREICKRTAPCNLQKCSRHVGHDTRLMARVRVGTSV